MLNRNKTEMGSIHSDYMPMYRNDTQLVHRSSDPHRIGNIYNNINIQT